MRPSTVALEPRPARALPLAQLGAVLMGSALFGTAGCSGPAPTEAPAARNLILVSVDTLRADRLGCYGAERPTSPALDAFAARAVRFERAYAAAPWTLPSHVTMLSGLLPTTHGVELPDLRPGADTRLLTEELADAGFYTYAGTDGGWMGSDFGLDRGFLGFDEADVDVEQRFALALERILAAHGERRFFAFVHTYDVHCPYTPGPPYDALFRSEGATPIETAGRCGNPDYNALDLGPAEARFLADAYDGGVRRMDDALGGFLASLEAAGVLDDTVVVVTSDHGEEFLEHGRIGHEESLYPELLHVPLILSAPGAAARTVSEPVSLVDLAPTVLELLGLPPLADVDGRSLAASIDGIESPPRGVQASLAWKRSLRASIDGEHLRIRGEGRTECFDLARDPLALRDLTPTGACPPEAFGSQAALGSQGEATRPPRRTPLPALPGTDTARALNQLGYVGR